MSWLNLATPKLRTGDIYRWRWADPEKDRDSGSFGAYHCYSLWAVVNENGRLEDTYWSGMGNKILDQSKVVLTFVANKSDLTEIRDYDISYYRREDVVDMRHANNSRGPIYLRNGATKNAEAMLAEAERRLEDAVRDKRFAEDRIKDWTKAARLITEGKLDEVHF